MNQNHAESRQSPAILVVNCSDSRLTAEDASASWKTRLGFDGDIFEVRCPGGGLALADSDSAFYKSALGSFQLLSTGRNFSRIILAFHQDCAYFQEKYGSSGDPADDEQRKWQLIEQATQKVSGWARGIAIRPLYLTFEENGDCRHSGAALEPERQPAMPPRPTTTTVARQERRFSPASALNLRSYNRIVEEMLITEGRSVEDAIAQAEDQSGTFAGVPPWQVERQAGVFLDLLRGGGRTNPQELRQLVRAFVQNYAGDQASKPLIRSVMNELNEVIETGAKRRLG